METDTWQIAPLPVGASRAVTVLPGRGGWAPWRPVQGRILGRPPGRVRQPWRIRGLGRPWPYLFRWTRQVRELRGLGPRPGQPSRGYMAPPKNFSWGSSPLGAVQEERTLVGAGEERALGCAGEERALGCPQESTCEEQALEGTCEEQALEGTCKARTLGGALEARTLGGALEARTLGGALEARTLGALWKRGHSSRVEPSSPQAAEPSSPRAAEPSSPRTAEPSSPRAAEPSLPRAAAGWGSPDLPCGESISAASSSVLVESSVTVCCSRKDRKTRGSKSTGTLIN